MGNQMSVSMRRSQEDLNKTHYRFLDVAGEPLHKLLSPIDGYQDVPLLGLEKAIQPVMDLIPGLKSRVWISMENCRQPDDGLTNDESAAIHLYTMEWTPHEKSLYFVLNQALRSEDRSKLRVWFPYLKLFLTALYKIPSSKRTLWRGVRADLSQHYPSGKKFAWWGVSSCTDSIETLESSPFLGKNGTRTLFSIECVGGKSITAHAHFQNENEIILAPGSYFQVMGQLNQGSGLCIIHLQQLVPPHELIVPPFSLQQHQEPITATVPKLMLPPLPQRKPDSATKIAKVVEPKRKIDYDTHQFALDALKQHNKCRQWHDAYPLSFSELLSNKAQLWAEKLAKEGHITNLGVEDYGTNVLCLPEVNASGSVFTRLLYSEVNPKYQAAKKSSGYNYNPTFYLYDLDFRELPQAAQIIYGPTKQVGFGRALTNNGRYVYLTAVYDVKPTANIIGNMKLTTKISRDGFKEWEKESNKSVICSIQ